MLRKRLLTSFIGQLKSRLNHIKEHGLTVISSMWLTDVLYLLILEIIRIKFTVMWFIRMNIIHILFGQSWLFYREVHHEKKNNTFSFLWKGWWIFPCPLQSTKLSPSTKEPKEEEQEKNKSLTLRSQIKEWRMPLKIKAKQHVKLLRWMKLPTELEDKRLGYPSMKDINQNEA